jgi:hypothetical protein
MSDLGMSDLLFLNRYSNSSVKAVTPLHEPTSLLHHCIIALQQINGCGIEVDTPLRVMCLAVRRSSNVKPGLKVIDMHKLTAPKNYKL